MTTNAVLLYAPMNRPERAAKALVAGADGVVLDLEDAVPPREKEEARAALSSFVSMALRSAPDVALQVRVNAPNTPWHADDVACVASLPPEVGIRVPKTERPDAVEELAGLLPGRELHLLVESAVGLERAFGLATVAGVASLGMGEADLRADLGVTSDDALGWPRSRVVVAASAAGLPSPLMAAYTNVGDEEGLEASCRQGAALGFWGRSAIHPTQVAVIRRVFTPTPEELARAVEVLEAATRAAETGSGAVLLADGRFVDEAIVKQAQRLLARS